MYLHVASSIYEWVIFGKEYSKKKNRRKMKNIFIILFFEEKEAEEILHVYSGRVVT